MEYFLDGVVYQKLDNFLLGNIMADNIFFTQ